DAEKPTVRDDTEKAVAYAESLREANEGPKMAGSFTLDYFDHDFVIGTPIWGTTGRTCSFRLNTQAEAQTFPRFPLISGRVYDFDRGQRTTYLLSDERV
ncbi:unnamed protein product, partial [Phaeothamnion confervicola]